MKALVDHGIQRGLSESWMTDVRTNTSSNTMPQNASVNPLTSSVSYDKRKNEEHSGRSGNGKMSGREQMKQIDEECCTYHIGQLVT